MPNWTDYGIEAPYLKLFSHLAGGLKIQTDRGAPSRTFQELRGFIQNRFVNLKEMCAMSGMKQEDLDQ